MDALRPNEIAKLAFQFLRDTYALSRRPFWDKDEIKNYQLKKIKERLHEARNDVPLYQHKNIPDPETLKSLEDFSKLSLLTKEELLSAEPGSRLNKNFKVDQLVVSKSSGSTGKALDVFYDLESYNLFILAGLRLYRMAFNYLPWHKQTYIYTSAYPLKSLMGMYPLHFISTLTPIEETIQELRKNPPDLLVCYPSHLRSIADKMTPADFKIIRPRAINVNSEMSTPGERAYLGKLFNSFVFDDYSSEELTRIASQCTELQYHLFDDINYMEVVDDEGHLLPEGQVGHLVGTNLHNRGMPLIRYMQGDKGAIISKRCPCGSQFRILENFQGRKNDEFILSDGTKISSGKLLDLTYAVFLDYPGAVSAFCLIQEEPDLWFIELVPGSKWENHLETLIPENFKKVIGIPFIEIQSKVVKDVTKTKSGKANPIISKIKRSV